jgi:hypothetical protein
LDEEVGGSIRINIKPSQTFELTFNPQDEGVGAVDVNEPEMPQSNPWQTEPEAAEERPETYIYIDRDQADFTVTTSVTITTQDVIQLRSQLIELGEDAVEGIPRDDHLQQQLNDIKAALDDHTHLYIPALHPGPTPVATEASTDHGYSVGDTATDLVKGV